MKKVLSPVHYNATPHRGEISVTTGNTTVLCTVGAEPVSTSFVGDSCVRRNDMHGLSLFISVHAVFGVFLALGFDRLTQHNLPSLKRVARFIGSGDDQKSRDLCVFGSSSVIFAKSAKAPPPS